MSSDKLDLDYFEYVIAYNCYSNETYVATIVDSVNLRYFENKSIRTFLNVIFNFYNKRGTLPTGTEIRAHLTSGKQQQAVKDIASRFKYISKDFNQEELLQNTEKFLRERAVYYAVLDTVEQNSKKDEVLDTQVTFDLFEKACNISLIDNLGFEYFDQINQHIKDLQTTDETFSTGWPWLDKKLGGGLNVLGRALYIFCGVTNVGKSIFLGNIGINALKQNKAVTLLTLEMPEHLYAKRFSGQLTRIPLRDLAKEPDLLKQTLLDFKKEHPKANLIIKEFPPKSIAVNNIRAYLKKLQMKGKLPDLLIVDYLNLLRSSIDTGSSYEDVKRITEQLRALSYVFEIPIVSATQLNRDAFDQINPGMETVSESIGTAMTCDAQFSIWQDEADKELGLIHLGMMKNRFGPNFGSTVLKIDYDTLFLEESEDVLSNTDEVSSISSGLSRLAE